MSTIDSRVGSDSPGLPAALRDALTDLARTERLLVALDFDGTLAPLVDDPEASRALPAADTALRALADVPGVGCKKLPARNS